MLHLLAVGINYIGTPNRLSGCINDARRWYNLFKGQRTLLLEQDATRQGILSAIRRLVDVEGEVVITLSGHGTDIPDSGTENDTAFVPYDLKLIKDDEFAELFSLMKAHVLFITDCCHSGTMSRGDVARYIDYKSLPPQELVNVSRTVNSNVLHLSGCKDSEVSLDQKFGSEYYGNLTYHASREFTPGITYKQWYEAFMPLKGQTPQMSGPMNRLVPGSTPQEGQGPTIYWKKGDTLYVPTGWRPASG